MPQSFHFPLKCRCHANKWDLHPTKIICTNCNFTEHFEFHETMHEVMLRMKSQGCYFLDRDSKLLDNALKVQLTSYEYR